jgi:ThiF family
MENLASLLSSTQNAKNLYAPLLFKPKIAADRRALNELIDSEEVLFVFDEIISQLQELIKIKSPTIKIKQAEYPDLINKHLAGTATNDYGVWVYYPWSQTLVHLLDEEEFIEVRTNRNKYKITKEEQEMLRGKKVGIVGLSVGQSIALTMAMERICGELRLADFDTAELSNLNRIRTGTNNLGLNKTVIAAREIAEIDPFIKVKIFNDGLHTGNIDDFFLNDGKLDLFVEVCDGIDIKFESRFKARELQVPVIMDTNDRGMLDVERFDLEPGRNILHGKVESFVANNAILVTDDNRMSLVKEILDFDALSPRLKLSMTEIGKTINTWPQLASSVVLGGAITTDFSRRILLNESKQSGRYYVDLDDIFKE